MRIWMHVVGVIDVIRWFIWRSERRQEYQNRLFCSSWLANIFCESRRHIRRRIRRILRKCSNSLEAFWGSLRLFCIVVLLFLSTLADLFIFAVFRSFSQKVNQKDGPRLTAGEFLSGKAELSFVLISIEWRTSDGVDDTLEAWSGSVTQIEV